MDADNDVLGTVASQRPICIGGPNGYAGAVDEVRIYRQALTREWIDAEIDNVVDRAAFVRIEP
jgi:hypothetical protein